MINDLVKVELGCGTKKTEGYIGVDRFLLPGVDIVSDLNEQLPFEESYVDIIWACHSLEHLNDLYYTMSEIYRVCKHKAIVHILAPYYNTSLNIANFYHKNVFNEETFRFFSKYPKGNINLEEYYRPHSLNWGLSQSDNSNSNIEISLINIEFFYYDEYYNLSENEKRRARKSLLNVCDQVYYTLVINKGTNEFSEEEINSLRKKSKEEEPKIIESLRNRHMGRTNSISIYDDISEFILKNIKKDQIIQNSMNEEFKCNINKLENLLQKQNRELIILKESNNNMKSEINKVNLEKNSIAAFALENFKCREKTNIIFKKKRNIINNIRKLYPEYIELLKNENPNYTEKAILQISKIIPFESYIEYKVNMNGRKSIHYFLFACLGSNLIVEIVQENMIIKNEIINIDHEGEFVMNLENCDGIVFLRFRAIDNHSIVRVLELHNRKKILMTQKYIACFVK